MAFEPKLSPDARADVENSSLSAPKLADRYKVSVQTVYNVRRLARKRSAEAAEKELEKTRPRPAAAADAWANLVYQPTDTTNRLYVPPEIIPDGMDYQWNTVEVFGAPMPQRHSWFERQGWRAVPAERHPGIWTPLGTTGSIVVDGLMLQERPLSWTQRARAYEQRIATEQLNIKRQQLTGGDMPGVSPDASMHPSALRTNFVRTTRERITVPEE